MPNSININGDGTVASVSIFAGEYPYICPDFIHFGNFGSMKCINIADHMNPDSWVEIEESQPI